MTDPNASPTAPAPGADPLPELLQDLRHDVWEVRRNAAEELAALNDRRATIPLCRCLDDGVGGVRYAAAEALGRIQDPLSIPSLIKLLGDPTFGVYGPVIEALANMRAMGAVPYFIGFLQHDDARIRSLAANSLLILTRQPIPFKAKGKPEERAQGYALWEQWWDKNKEHYHELALQQHQEAEEAARQAGIGVRRAEG
ncbi:MAG: HEAT repeat domain-containing protein [Planctomycetota bacterium]